MAEENKKRAICIFLYYIILCLLGVGWITTGSIILHNLVLDSDVKNILNIITIFSLGLGDDIEILSGTIIAIGCVTVLYAVTKLVLHCYNRWKGKHEDQLSERTFKLICLFLVFLSGSTFIVVILWSHIHKKIQEDEPKEYLLENLKKYFTEDADVVSDLVSFPNSWNKIFMELDCCAVNPVYSTTNDFDNTPWCTTSGECQQTNSQIPKTCCKDVTVSTYTSAQTNCHANVDRGTYNTKGCYEVLRSKIVCYSSAVIGVGVPLLLFLVLGVFVAWKEVCRDTPVDIGDKEKCKVCKTAGHTPGTKSCKFYEKQNGRVVAFHDSDNVLSNLFVKDITFEGETHKTAEHAFQLSKALYLNNKHAAEKIRNAHNASTAKDIGDNLESKNIWDDVKEKVMLKILQAKFDQIVKFREEVQNCGRKRIIVLTTSDNYWGSGLDEHATLNTRHDKWPGKNKLGVLIKSLILHDEA